MQYTELELNQLIQDVEKEFSTHLAKAAEEKAPLAKSEAAETAPLAKAEDKKPEAKEEKKPEEKKPEEKPAEAAPKAEGEKEEAPKAEGKEEAPKAEAKPGEEKPAAEGEKPEEAPKADAEGEGHDYDDEDLEHMHKMYSSMSKGELKAHHDAVRRALDGQGMEKCGDMSMAKSEKDTAVEVPADLIAKAAEVDLLKSELANKTSKMEELKKSNEVMQEFIAKILGKKSAPQGKAITNLEVIAKSGSETSVEEKPLSKSEITSILNKKASEPTLSKADRDLINAYCLRGASVNTIKHLLA